MAVEALRTRNVLSSIRSGHAPAYIDAASKLILALLTHSVQTAEWFSGRIIADDTAGVAEARLLLFEILDHAIFLPLGDCLEPRHLPLLRIAYSPVSFTLGTARQVFKFRLKWVPRPGIRSVGAGSNSVRNAAPACVASPCPSSSRET